VKELRVIINISTCYCLFVVLAEDKIYFCLHLITNYFERRTSCFVCAGVK